MIVGPLSLQKAEQVCHATALFCLQRISVHFVAKRLRPDRPALTNIGAT
jgi:hypothetical protein